MEAWSDANQSLFTYIMCSSLNWKWWQSYHVPLYWWPSAVHQSIKSLLLANVQLYFQAAVCARVCARVCRTCCVDSVQTSGDVLFLRACSIHQRALSTVWRHKDMVNGVMRKCACVCVWNLIQWERPWFTFTSPKFQWVTISAWQWGDLVV